MEWGQIVLKKKGKEVAINRMIGFFVGHSYLPIANNFYLTLSEWKDWPWDIMWIRK
jgi:hypothetical protein